MPKINGFEFLEWKKGQPNLSHLPVVMWSSSDFERDKDRAAGLGAVDYIVKPVFGHGLTDAIEQIYKRLTEARANSCS
jgi:CheY-like chemotaxis protein